MAVTISGTVTDVGGGKDARPWKVWSPGCREGTGGVVTRKEQLIYPVGGTFTAELEPGSALIESPDGERWNVEVPDYDTSLWSLIGPAVSLPPDTAADLLKAAVAAYFAGNPDIAELVGAVSDYDSRLDDTRTPTAGSVGLEQLTAALAAALAYVSAAGSGVVRIGRNSDDSAQASQVEIWVSDGDGGSTRVLFWNSSGEYVSGNLRIGGNTDSETRAARINAAAGQVRSLSFQTAGVDRWQLMVDGDPESGSDAGSNISLRSRTDLGGAKTTLIAIDRQTGVATLGGLVVAITPTTSYPSLRLPHGVAPTSPTNGDVWTTTVGAYIRINGVTRKITAAPVVSTAQLLVQNTTTETDLISKTLAAGELIAGTTYRISLRGTIQVQATSGTLTFTPYLGGNAATTIVLPTQASAAGPVGFWLDVLITVRTTGASGTYIACGGGLWPNGGWFALNANSLSTAVVDTTAATPVVKVTGKWATASTTNILKVETAVIEQVA